jgi:hypothetical protein
MHNSQPSAVRGSGGSTRSYRALQGGHYLAGLGAMALIVSLFLPWYRLELPGPLAFQFPYRVEGDAWQVFSGVDIALFAYGVIVLCLTVLATGIAARALSVRPSHVSNLIALAGAGATGFVAWKLIDQPDPQQVFSIEYGAFVALAGALAMGIGGWTTTPR